MGILLRNKLKRRRNAVVYTTVFTVAAIVFTVSTFATHNKTEYVHENETSYAVDISGIDIDKLEAAREEVEETAKADETKTTDKNKKKTTNKEEETTTAEKLSKKLAEYKGVFVTNVTGNLNVRAAADPTSDVVGVLEENDGGKVVKYGSQWTKINSGKVVGYVATGYIAIGKKAKKILKSTSQVAEVNTDTLMVRKKDSKKSDVLGMVGKGETFAVTSETDKWVKINYEGQDGYLNKKYVKLETKMSYAMTIEEIDAIRIAEAQAEKESLEAAYLAAIAEQETQAQQTQAYVEPQTQAPTQAAVSSTTAAPETQAPTTAAAQNAPEPEQRQQANANVDDAYLLACLVTCEAGNQPYEGKLAVANVVLNRVASSRFPNSISGVIYQSGQFGPAYTSLPARLQSGPDAGSLQAANDALAGNNNVPGYYSFNVNSAIDTSRLNSYKIIGAHTFY